MSTIPGVQVQGEGDQPTRFYAACENSGCGVCGPIRGTEGAAHADAREHALVCSSAEFLGIPEAWLDDPTWKCANGHVSKRYLKSEALGGDVCLACREPVRLCDPDEREVTS